LTAADQWNEIERFSVEALGGYPNPEQKRLLVHEPPIGNLLA